MADTARQRWLYSGIALADGVGLVSQLEPPPSEPPPPPEAIVALPSLRAPAIPASPTVRRPLLGKGQRAALFGDALATGLTAAVAHLAKEADVMLGAQGRPISAPHDWLMRGWFDDVLRAQPHVVLAAFRWPPDLNTTAMHRLELVATERASRVVWVAPPGVAEDRIVAVAQALQQLRAGRLFWPHRIFRSDGLQIPLGPDGAVPTARGYAGWAGALWSYLS